MMTVRPLVESVILKAFLDFYRRVIKTVPASRERPIAYLTIRRQNRFKNRPYIVREDGLAFCVGMDSIG